MAINSHQPPGASSNISTESDYYAFLEGIIPQYEGTLRALGYGETARTIIADHSLNAWEITRVDTQIGLAFDEMSTEPRARLAQEARQCLEETLRDIASPETLGFDPDQTSGTGKSGTDTERPAPEPIDFAGELQEALVELENLESHTEYEPSVIHASQIGYCERQAYLAKFGLKQYRRPRDVSHRDDDPRIHRRTTGVATSPLQVRDPDQYYNRWHRIRRSGRLL